MEVTMLAKKLVLLAGTAAALTTASAAFAGYYDSYGRYHYSYPDRVVVEQPVYAAPPVYYSAPSYYSYYNEPAPSYYYSPAPSYYYAPSGAATGAVAGALIGGSIADRHHRAEGAVAGALLGGVIGSQYDRYSY
jgi:glycine zipper 2TM protein